MISREQAAEIAKMDALANGIGISIEAVMLVEEITSRAPTIYGVSLDNCWIAYVNHEKLQAISSSTIIIVDRSSGDVRYRGSANDEG